MKFSLPINILIAAMGLALLASCNADNEDEEWNVMTYSNVGVKSFKLGKNDSVLAHLDTVFFSIDLDGGRIFNADSLPRGTRTDSLTVSIGLPSVSSAMIYFEGPKGTDSVNYMTNSTDVIDFSRGPARLALTSIDGLAKREYAISVNVHRMNPDSLAWGATASRRLPTDIAATDSRTVALDGLYYCLTTGAGGAASMAVADNIEGEWDIRRCSLPAGARTLTFSAADHRLFILDGDGSLFASADGGATWTAAGARMSHVYGAYGTELIGSLRRADGSYALISYPSATDEASAPSLPEGCPVSGTSTLLEYTTKWSARPMVITTGGLTASGELTGASWVYDGSKWECISIAAGAPRQGMSVVPYLGYRTDEYWVVRDYNVLLAFGGAGNDGRCSNEVWISFDRGIHWTQGSESLQMPATVPALRFASAIVENQTLTGSINRSATTLSSLWAEYPAPALPSRARIDLEWQCPYIYIIGGYTNGSQLSTAIWRGAINRLTFRPLF